MRRETPDETLERESDALTEKLASMNPSPEEEALAFQIASNAMTTATQTAKAANVVLNLPFESLAKAIRIGLWMCLSGAESDFVKRHERDGAK